MDVKLKYFKLLLSRLRFCNVLCLRRLGWKSAVWITNQRVDADPLTVVVENKYLPEDISLWSSPEKVALQTCLINHCENHPSFFLFTFWTVFFFFLPSGLSCFFISSYLVLDLIISSFSHIFFSVLESRLHYTGGNYGWRAVRGIEVLFFIALKQLATTEYCIVCVKGCLNTKTNHLVGSWTAFSACLAHLRSFVWTNGYIYELWGMLQKRLIRIWTRHFYINIICYGFVQILRQDQSPGVVGTF